MEEAVAAEKKKLESFNDFMKVKNTAFKEMSDLYDEAGGLPLGPHILMIFEYLSRKWGEWKIIYAMFRFLLFIRKYV